MITYNLIYDDRGFVVTVHSGRKILRETITPSLDVALMETRQLREGGVCQEMQEDE